MRGLKISLTLIALITIGVKILEKLAETNPMTVVGILAFPMIVILLIGWRWNCVRSSYHADNVNNLIDSSKVRLKVINE